MPKGSPTPWSYLLIRLLFKFVLRIFYGSIVVENTELIPETGRPCIVCANHSNSLTDALLLVDAVPSKIRNMLRLTAKSTQFGKRTFTSWLIESAGTVPIKRRKDFGDTSVDNSEVMSKLMEALEIGDAICLFPEGASRYHPTIAPLKTGVSRIVSDVLTRNRDNPDFEISVLTCSITYMHRQHFRSDVLVTFNPPMTFRVKDSPNLLAPVPPAQIRALTSHIHHAISSNTLDAPSWEMVRAGKMAARLYAPLGTRMSLGDYVRVVRAFVEGFKERGQAGEEVKSGIVNGDENLNRNENLKEDAQLTQLRHDLKIYQDLLARHTLKDDHILQPPTLTILPFYLLIRLIWSLILLVLSLPGLILWLPVFVTTFYGVHNFKKRGGPVWDTWDEIAQYKLVYGLLSGVCVWVACILLTLPVAGVTSVLVPSLMWITLRWLEDAISGFRAFAALVRLLLLLSLPAGRDALHDMRTLRADLHPRIMNLAVHTLGLPPDPKRYFADEAGASGLGIGAGIWGRRQNFNKGRVRSSWESGARYFSVRRRRKKDWNETLRLYDKTDYPADDDVGAGASGDVQSI